MQACLEAHAAAAAALALPQLAAALRRLAGDSVLGPDERAALLAAPLAAAFFPRWAGGDGWRLEPPALHQTGFTVG